MTRLSRGTLHVLGETESADFPRSEPGAPGLRGPSDALWVGLETRPNGLVPRFSRLFGGQGRDRLIALLEPSPGAADRNWVLVGDTTSSSLAQGGAAARPYAGGTDWFAAWFDPVSAAWQRHSYYGGGGDERLFFAGWREELLMLAGSTSSAALPLQEPFLDRYGGGATGGLLVQMRASGYVALASYFGGDGADRILGSCERCFPLARRRDSVLPPLNLLGVSDSASWPATTVAADPAPPGSRGGTDLIQAHILMSSNPETYEVLLARGIFGRLYVNLPVEPPRGPWRRSPWRTPRSPRFPRWEPTPPAPRA